MVISVRGICLPELNQRAANWMAVIVDNFPAYDDAFAEWFACMLSRPNRHRSGERNRGQKRTE